MKIHKRVILFFLLFSAIAAIGCPPRANNNPPPGDDVSGEVLGRYMFDTPMAFTEVGTLDTPRMASDPSLGTIHLTYILSEGNQQRIMYTRTENGEFRQPSFLSEREGQKMGGGYIFEKTPDNLIFYWINMTSTGGIIRYKTSSDGGRIFTMENRWNQRNQPRWPCVLDINRKTVAYFFLHSGDEWELVSNMDFSEEDEPTILYADDIPFHLQGVTDGGSRIWLAYFSRDENADGGRIAFLTSKDRGSSFDSIFLFEDKIIQNLTSFFQMAATGQGRDTVIHLIFTEESPELTTIYYSRSTDGGEEFSIPISVFASENPLTRAPLMLARDDYIFITTADTEDEGPSMRYVFSDDNGESFTEPAVATRSITSPETIAGVIGGDGSVVLVWDDLSAISTGGEQIYRLKGTMRGN